MHPRFPTILLIFLAWCLAPACAAEDVGKAISFDMATNWQPGGGAFRFDVSPALGAEDAPPLAYICPQQISDDFFPPAHQGKLNRTAATDGRNVAATCEPLTVQRLPSETATPSVSHFQAALPPAFNNPFKNLTSAYFSAFDTLATNGLFRQLIANGYLRVYVDDKTFAWFDVGLTSRKFSTLIAVATLLALCFALATFARRLRIPGPGDMRRLHLTSLPIRLISSSDGRASLSQFQVMLWTFVVVGGAIYVVALNGSLIPLSTGTLILLGISGASAVISQAKESKDAATPPSLPAPQRVQNLVVQALDDSSDLRVTWTPPLDRAPITHYVVEYSKVRSADGQPVLADGALVIERVDISPVVREAGVRLVGLDPQSLYHVSVSAANPAGRGEASDKDGPEKTKTTRSGPANGAAALDNSQLRAVLDQATDSSIELEWTPADANAYYDVQFRRADSLEDWTPAPPNPANPNHKSAVVRGLDSGVVYNFKLRRMGAANPWSAPIKAATVHIPNWTDLVTDPDRPSEIEVTRVQMLLFTVVSALFVTLRIADTGAIPEIPQEYVLLMGISNGVYLTSKWARR